MNANHLTTVQVAQMWGVTDRTVRHWIEKGLIQAVRYRQNGRANWRIPKSAVGATKTAHRQSVPLQTLVDGLRKNRLDLSQTVISSGDLLSIVILIAEHMQAGESFDDAMRRAQRGEAAKKVSKLHPLETRPNPFY
jgi:excisionase family DNA binding protein